MRGWGGTFLSVNGKERVPLQSQADSQGQGAAATLMAVSGHPLGPDGQESHGGLRLAARRRACSSDPPPMQIWNNDLTISLLHSADMRPYNWSYTQFSQFNQDDSLLLASGVFLGPHNSSSGEIAVISLGESGRGAAWPPPLPTTPPLPAGPAPSHWPRPRRLPSSCSPQTTSCCCPVCATSPTTCSAAGSQRPA